MRLIDVQMDRLVGPTHHFGGLGVGNIASAEHAGHVSNPAAAAIQGLDKMRLVASLGAPQMIVPPHVRPDLSLLRSLGFQGSRTDILRHCFDAAPKILSAAMSCSAMWTANAATVAPAIDCRNSRTSIVTANLNGSLHRASEPPQTHADLQTVFSDVAVLHPPLQGGSATRDEGAANHIRLGNGKRSPGIHLFVHGDSGSTRFWPRQTRTASESVARNLGLDSTCVFFLQQSAAAIDAGAFHNDVVAASHDDLLLYHESAFEESQQLHELDDRYRAVCGRELKRVVVSEEELSLEETVATYLFNSQIVASPDAGSPPILICPSQVEASPNALRIVRRWRDELPFFSQLHFVDLQQSMSGGGGPACLRLRVPLTEHQIERLPVSMRWSEQLDEDLRELIGREYPTRLTLKDLADEDFVGQTERARQRVANRILSDAVH